MQAGNVKDLREGWAWAEPMMPGYLIYGPYGNQATGKKWFMQAEHHIQCRLRTSVISPQAPTEDTEAPRS